MQTEFLWVDFFGQKKSSEDVCLDCDAEFAVFSDILHLQQLVE